MRCKAKGVRHRERKLNVKLFVALSLNPNFAYLRRGKMRKGATGVAANRLGQVEAYLTVREVLSEASTAADGVL